MMIGDVDLCSLSPISCIIVCGFVCSIVWYCIAFSVMKDLMCCLIICVSVICLGSGWIVTCVCDVLLVGSVSCCVLCHW